MKSRENFIRDRQLFESSNRHLRRRVVNIVSIESVICSSSVLKGLWGVLVSFFCFCILGASCLAKIGILFNIFTRSLSPQTEISFNDISLSRKIIC